MLAEAVAAVLALSAGARWWGGGLLGSVYAVAVAVAVVIAGTGNVRLRGLLGRGC